ncbi:MAG: hypothetical protein E6K58_03090 [Nitrospirae bacterium]|nr:MAG: hypothetical protein E6K58_03090 [Nitrospirota bacterium]
MIARVIFGLRRYVHSPLIVKGYSVNRLPVFLSPLSPPPHPSPSRGEGKVGVGLFATGTAPSSSPLPSPPPHGPLHWESNGHPGGEGGGLFATVSTPWFPMARRSCRRVSTQNSV